MMFPVLFFLFFFAEELREHFSQFGEIESVSVKTDPASGRSRGFAFIVFKDVESIEKVMAAGDHIINCKKIDPKKAKARHGKIFVGGLDVETSEEDIRNFFGQFGTVSEPPPLPSSSSTFSSLFYSIRMMIFLTTCQFCF